MVQKFSTIDELKAEIENENNKGKLVLVDFFATWCGPCVRISPKLEEWSSGDFKDSVVFLKIDVDEVEEATKVYKIEAMPTFVFFKDGEEIHRLVGANVEQLKADIESKSQ